MGAALVCVDIVRERIHRLGVAVIPLKRYLGLDTVSLATHVDRLLVDCGFVFVQMRYERNNAAFVVKLVCLAVPLIVQGNDDAAVEEGKLTKPLGERVKAEVCGLENSVV